MVCVGQNVDIACWVAGLDVSTDALIQRALSANGRNQRGDSFLQSSYLLSLLVQSYLLLLHTFIHLSRL